LGFSRVALGVAFILVNWAFPNTGWFCAPALAASSGRHVIEADFEAVATSDIVLTQGVAAYQHDRGLWNLKLSLSGASIGFDYQPAADIDLATQPRAVDHLRFSGQLDARLRVHPRLTLLGSLGGYDGFTSFRSAWVNEWYQQWFAGLPGLRQAEPHGVSGNVGVRWEFLPAAGLVEAGFIYGYDHIAPAYDEVLHPDLGLVAVRPLRSDLGTVAFRLAFENVLTRRLRTRVELRSTDQSERDARHSIQGAANYALGENWVARAEAGYAVEDPEFEAKWFAGTIERRLGEHFYVSATGRYYHDAGEIENTISFSSSAPGLEAWQAGLGLRWVSGGHSVKLYGAPYFTNYAPVDFTTLFFGPLYRDRTFAVVQLAYSFEF
jgi:hypothetical protein